MPVRWLLGPKGERVEFRDAPAYFDRLGIMPAAAVKWLIEERDRSAYLSPSLLDPESTCRREAIIERIFDYGIDPRDKWLADEGTTWHEAFAARTHGEIELPSEQDRGHPKVQECADGKLRLEVYPGVLMRAYVDEPTDWTEINDYKTQKYPKTYGGKNAKAPIDYREKDKDKYENQLNTYADMAEMLGRTSVVKRLVVWCMYRGSHDKTRTWLRLDIPRLRQGAVWERIKGWAEPFLEWLNLSTHVETESEKIALLKSIPMDGNDKQMFNGKKCSDYCAVRDICYKHAEGWSSW